MSLAVDAGSPVTTDYAWDVSAALPVILDDGTNQYVYGLDLISGTDASDNQTFYSYDGLGSTTDLTDDTGTATDGYSYDVFGTVRDGSGTSVNQWLFTGEQQDADSSLYFLRARYYEPSTGRFLSRDSFAGVTTAPGTQNLYSYSLGNPVNRTDPTGHYSVLDFLQDMRPVFTCALAGPTSIACVGEYIKAIVEYNEFVFDFLARFGTLNCLNAALNISAVAAGFAFPNAKGALWATLYVYQLFGWANSGVVNVAQIDEKEGASFHNAVNVTGLTADLIALEAAKLAILKGGFQSFANYTGIFAAGISTGQCIEDVVGG